MTEREKLTMKEDFSFDYLEEAKWQNLEGFSR